MARAGVTPKGDKLAISLLCISLIVSVVLFLVEKTPLTVVSLLLLIVALAIYPIWHFCRANWVRLTVFVIVIAGTFALGRHEWPRATIAHSDALVEWRLIPPTSYVKVDTSKISAPPDYRVMLICRASNPHVDAFQDTVIDKSNTFAINGQMQDIGVDNSAGTVARLNPDGEMEAYIAVIPPSINPAQISRLADVKSLGGSVWTGGAQGVRIGPFPHN